jgi:hypothetical protein
MRRQRNEGDGDGENVFFLKRAKKIVYALW